MDKSRDYDEICFECTGYGDDYYLDDDGELVPACPECWVTKERMKSDKHS